MVSVAVFDFDDTLLQSEQCKADTIREIVSEYEGGLDAWSEPRKNMSELELTAAR